MHVLTEANSDGARSEEMRSILANRGITLRAVKLFPQSTFPHDIAGAEDIPLDANVVCFGGPALMQHIRQNRRWKPGGWCTFENFSCHVYYSYFGKFLANETYSLLPASEAVRLSSHLFEQYSVGGEVFARPSMGRKLFTGRKFDIEEFIETIAKCPDPQSLILVTRPKRIGREWRTYVAGSRICTFSQYAVNGERILSRDCPDQVLEFARKILAETVWRPDPIFSLDLCECDGQIRMLELNGFSCSSLYDCDLNLLMEAVFERANQT